MQRRGAATVAGAAAVTVVAAVLGLGATFGLFGLTEPGPDAGAGRTGIAAVVPGDGLRTSGPGTAAPLRDD
jgi:hypothetical protein